MVAKCFRLERMAYLKNNATRSNPVNVLQHMQGYLSMKLDNDDKVELIKIIES